MKLKTLVSTMAVLGLVSTSAYAALPKKPQASNTKVNNLTRRVQRLEAIVNRNQDNASDNPQTMLNRSWFNNVVISGEVKPVFGWSNRTMQVGTRNNDTPGTTTTAGGFLASKSKSAANLNTAELYIDAKVNSFAKLHAALDYDYDPNLYYNQISSNTPAKRLFFSEAAVQFANLAKSGLYANVGRQYFNFGSYQHDSISSPMTELLSKANGTGLTAGFVSKMGFNVDAYVFGGNLGKRDNPSYTTGQTHPSRLRTMGASAGYTMKNRSFGLNFQLGYLNNMAQTIYLSQAIVSRHGNVTGNNKTVVRNIPGISAHIDLSSGPFSLMFDYVTALRAASPQDLAAYAVSTNASNATATKGAKPSATFTQFAYNFNWMGHKNTPYVAYQTSKDTEQVYDSFLGGYYMPKSRITLGYMYYVGRNVDLNLEYDHDKDFKKHSTTSNATGDGSGRTSESVNLGVTVKF